MLQSMPLLVKQKNTMNVTHSHPLNFFTRISFGGCPCGVYGGTPAKILHTALLGLCRYIIDGIKITFTQHKLDQLLHAVVGIYKDSRRQRERGIPYLGLF